MAHINRKQHWDKIYLSKQSTEVSWYQPTPETSLSFISALNIPPSAKIIDIGGGDSLLVDHLLQLGYRDITVLDISEVAIHRAKQRLGDRAHLVKWIVADAVSFQTNEQYDVWHDRAAFHFLTNEHDIASYIETAQKQIKPSGLLIIGTFSEQGPRICSGVNIKQYSEKTLPDCLKLFFKKIRCITVDHLTPSNVIQNFLFCSFRKIQIS